MGDDYPMFKTNLIVFVTETTAPEKPSWIHAEYDLEIEARRRRRKHTVQDVVSLLYGDIHTIVEN